MSRIKFSLLIATIVAVCNSDPVNISGAVVDSSGKGIVGAEVLLEKANITAQTDENGLFTLTGTPTGAASGKGLSARTTNGVPFIENGRLNFTLGVESTVAVTAYSLQGRVVYRANKMMGVGRQALAMPVPGDGVYLCRVKIGNTEYCVKGTFVRNSKGRAYGSSVVKMEDGTEKLAKKAAVIDDILTVRKEGFLDDRMIVSESVMEIPVIKMIVNAGNLTDIDGNVYQTVRIGNQVWMAENLRVTRYNDGTEISLETDSVSWSRVYQDTLTTPKYCFYNNTTNADSIKKFGALYNWHVVDTTNSKKITPSGWHVPGDTEWDTLQKFLIANGYNWDGTTSGNKIAKAMSAKIDWLQSIYEGTVGNDLSGNNRSGFSALPGGIRDYNYGSFSAQGSSYWWSATKYDTLYAWSCGFSSSSESLGRGGDIKACGLSVRLLKD